MSSLKEIDIINIFKRNFSTLPHILIGIKSQTGINEDCGVIDLGLDDQVLVITTDLISKKRHAPFLMSYKQMGMKAITVNVSDLAAMGARPLGLVMSLGFPEKIYEQEIDELGQGMEIKAKKYDTCVFGGDVNRTDDLIIAGTAIGITNKRHLMTRHGAKVGDLVAVTGNIGLAASGFTILQENNEKLIKKFPNSVKAALEPDAKIKFSLDIAKTSKITAIGDITDGLAWELHKIGTASNVGIEIEEKSIPIHVESLEINNLLKNDLHYSIFHVGEDFELVFTLKEENLDDILRIAKDHGEKISIIGKTQEPSKGVTLRNKNNEIKNLQRKGWDQFTSTI
ncbi:MAG: thiamine-phosphate kinase [Candidatus Lokiarchaeota archaeon]|nr:thiamine-phosphate kinase [Candidatus Lokiarchaeota archaeon]